MIFDFPASISGVLGLLVCSMYWFLLLLFGICLFGFLFVCLPPPLLFRGARQGAESRAFPMLSKRSTNGAASQTQAQRAREPFLIEVPPRLGV